jgi:hypothetical protein
VTRQAAEHSGLGDHAVNRTSIQRNASYNANVSSGHSGDPLLRMSCTGLLHQGKGGAMDHNGPVRLERDERAFSYENPVSDQGEEDMLDLVAKY